MSPLYFDHSARIAGMFGIFGGVGLGKTFLAREIIKRHPKHRWLIWDFGDQFFWIVRKDGKYMVPPESLPLKQTKVFHSVDEYKRSGWDGPYSVFQQPRVRDKSLSFEDYLELVCGTGACCAYIGEIDLYHSKAKMPEGLTEIANRGRHIVGSKGIGVSLGYDVRVAQRTHNDLLEHAQQGLFCFRLEIEANLRKIGEMTDPKWIPHLRSLPEQKFLRLRGGTCLPGLELQLTPKNSGE